MSGCSSHILDTEEQHGVTLIEEVSMSQRRAGRPRTLGNSQTDGNGVFVPLGIGASPGFAQSSIKQRLTK